MFWKWLRKPKAKTDEADTKHIAHSSAGGQQAKSKEDLIIEAEKSLDNEEKLLLKKLPGRSLMDFGWWEDRTGKRAERVLKKFLKLKLVKRPGPEEALYFLRNDELKQALASYGLKKTGKKEELVERLLANVDPSDLKNIVPKSLYKTWVYTEIGSAVVERFDEFLASKKREVEKEAFQLLLERNIDRAARLVFDLRDLKMEPYGLGDSDEAFKKGIKREVKKWLSYKYRDLDTTDDLRRKAGAAIALGALFGDAMRYGAAYLGDIFQDDFPCPSLKDFLEEHPEIYMAPSRATPKNLAKVYIHYHLFRFSNQEKKKQIMSLARKGFDIGIRISVIDDCPICNSGVLSARGDTINTIEKLPRHWGCRCTYVPAMRRS